MMKKQFITFILKVIVAIFFVGCAAPRYSVEEHKAFSIKGNSIIEGKITDEWKCTEVFIHPGTSYGRAVVRGDIGDNRVDPRYKNIVRSVTVSDGSFVFQNLSAGKYILTCNLSKLKWITGYKLAQAVSPESLSGLKPGAPIAVITPWGTFKRNSKGKWTPAGAMRKKSKDIKKKLILSDGQRQKITLP